jgi:predicted metal-binding protein
MRENGYADFRWISGKDVRVSQWPRFKCMYGCSSFGQKGSCPPSVPSVAECREFFCEYEHIAVIHFQKKLTKPEDRKEFSRKTNAKLGFPIEVLTDYRQAMNRYAFLMVE